MKLRTFKGQWFITTNSGETIVRDSSAEAWHYIFNNIGKETNR